MSASQAETLAALQQQMATLNQDVREMLARQRAQQELVDELMPVLKEMMEVASVRLQDLESRGYFAFGRALTGVLDRVVTGFSAQDVEALGDNVVRILSTVRSVTQPQIMAIADEATAALEEKSGEAMNWRGIFHASRDQDVQRGLATMVSVIRRVGRAAAAQTQSRHQAKDRMTQLLGARRTRPKPADEPTSKPLSEHLAPRRKPADACEPRTVRPNANKPPALVIAGLQLDGEGFMTDSNAWNRDVAVQVARAVGLEALTEDHWKVIEFARGSYAEAGKSPNVRALSVGSGVPIKQLYALFPPAPGKTAARVAGLPKPAGCI